jgi:ubiquitin
LLIKKVLRIKITPTTQRKKTRRKRNIYKTRTFKICTLEDNQSEQNENG